MKDRRVPGRCEVAYIANCGTYQGQFYTEKEPHIMAYSTRASSWEKFRTLAALRGASSIPANADSLPVTVKACVSVY
jgi:hypothetical protein